jgi:hypothetical protein
MKMIGGVEIQQKKKKSKRKYLWYPTFLSQFVTKALSISFFNKKIMTNLNIDRFCY